MKRIAITFIVFLFCTGMSVDEVPNPQTASGSFVQDYAGVLGPDYVVMIDGVCKEMEQKTSAEIAVVTIDNLGGLVVEDFAEQLFKKYGIGKKGKDNGILILFVLADRKVKIEVGYGLEGVMPDAKAGRLLDTYAVPWFKQGQFGRGIFMTVLRTAEEIAKAQKVGLSIKEPSEWPAQVIPPEPLPLPPQPNDADVRAMIKEKRTKQAMPVGFYVVGAIAFTLLSILLQMSRIILPRAHASKEKALGKGMIVPAIVWTVGCLGGFIFIAATEKFVLPIIGCMVGGVASTLLHRVSRSRFQKYIRAYRLRCPKCRLPMEMVSELSDDQYLTQEEMAEERAEGMDYEFWRCTPCEHLERLNVKMGGARGCKKCGRRTLTTTCSTIKAASYSSSGSERITYDCKNPKCDYHKEIVRTTPRLAKSSSGSSSSWGGGGSRSSGGGGSFGGGSSGGGGASRSW